MLKKLLPLLLLLASPLRAQLTSQGVEQPVFYSGKVASLAVNTPALNFSVTTGTNTFILSSQPETAARVYVVNETANACNGAFQISVATTSQKNIGSFNNNLQNWAAVPIINTSGSYAANSGLINIPALGSIVITSSAIAGQNVAVFVVNTTGACATTSIDVLVEFATVSITSPLINVAAGNNIIQPGLVANVQGVIAQGASLATVNPVAIGGNTVNNNSALYSVSLVGDSGGNAYNSMPIGGDKVGSSSTFGTMVMPEGSTKGPLAILPFATQANAGSIATTTLSDGVLNSATKNPSGLFTTNTGYFNSGSTTITVTPTVIPLFTPPGTGIYRSCYVTMQITAISGTAPTLDIFFQTGTSTTSGVFTDRIHFAQVTNVTQNVVAGVSDGVGITPQLMTNNTLAAATKVDGPIGAVGRFQFILGGTSPSYTLAWGIACS